MMLLYMTVGIVAGCISFWAILPYDPVWALISYPIVGSLAALGAGVIAVRRGARGP